VIAAEPLRSGCHREAHVQGWLASVLLHGTVVLAAMLLAKQIQLPPQDEPFKWNVTMVSPTQPVTPATSSPNQAPAPPVPSTTPVPSPPLQQTAPAKTPPSPQPLAEQTTPSITERTTIPVVTEPPVPPPPQPTEPIRNEAAATMIAEATSITKPAEAPKAFSSESDAPTTPASVPSAILEPTAQSDQAPAPTQMAALSPAPLNASTKRDYGWLSEAILRRVEELKRYPASARVDRAEGKVVVKAVINEDGSIGEVEVLQSSGHPGLDMAAVDTMRQAAPLHLPHPLGQPRVTVKIPMSYRLDR